MSDTPRTDRMVASWPLESFGEMTGLARQLERENAALRSQLAERDAELAALKGHAEDAERWITLCALWAHATELSLTQDEDGGWSIEIVEAVENASGAWSGATPDAAIDAARRAAYPKE